MPSDACSQAHILGLPQPELCQPEDSLFPGLLGWSRDFYMVHKMLKLKMALQIPSAGKTEKLHSLSLGNTIGSCASRLVDANVVLG